MTRGRGCHAFCKNVIMISWSPSTALKWTRLMYVPHGVFCHAEKINSAKYLNLKFMESSEGVLRRSCRFVPQDADRVQSVLLSGVGVDPCSLPPTPPNSLNNTPKGRSSSQSFGLDTHPTFFENSNAVCKCNQGSVVFVSRWAAAERLTKTAVRWESAAT